MKTLVRAQQQCRLTRWGSDRPAGRGNFSGGGIFYPIAKCRDYALFGCAAMRWLCALPTSLLDAARGDKTRRCGHLPYYLRHSLILLMVTVCRLTTTSSTSECVTSSYTRASSSCFYQLFCLLSLAISILTIFINCSKFPHANVCVYCNTEPSRFYGCVCYHISLLLVFR